MNLLLDIFDDSGSFVHYFYSLISIQRTHGSAVQLVSIFSHQFVLLYYVCNFNTGGQCR